MKKLIKGSVSNLDHLKIVGEIIFKIFKLGIKSYLNNSTENSKIEKKGEKK